MATKGTGKGKGDEIIRIKTSGRTGGFGKVAFFRLAGETFDIAVPVSKIDDGTIEVSPSAIAGPRWLLDGKVEEARARAASSGRPREAQASLIAEKLLDDSKEKAVRYLIEGGVPVWFPRSMVTVQPKRGGGYTITGPQSFLEEKLKTAREEAMARSNGGEDDEESSVIGSEIVRESEKAILIQFEDDQDGLVFECWFPKSKVEWEIGGQGVVVVGPRWAVENKVQEALEKARNGSKAA